MSLSLILDFHFPTFISSAPGDWVNCGLCGEWAHFGCDRRPGLGAFKVTFHNPAKFWTISSYALKVYKFWTIIRWNQQDYAKTDGLEYICPQCSVTNYKKKNPKSGNGYSWWPHNSLLPILNFPTLPVQKARDYIYTCIKSLD